VRFGCDFTWYLYLTQFYKSNRSGHIWLWPLLTLKVMLLKLSRASQRQTVSVKDAFLTRSSATAEIERNAETPIQGHWPSLKVICCCTNRRGTYDFLLAFNTRTLCLKKVPTFQRSVTLSNLNRFLKFVHCWKAYEICYITSATLPTSPEACCYTTQKN